MHGRDGAAYVLEHITVQPERTDKLKQRLEIYANICVAIAVIVVVVIIIIIIINSKTRSRFLCSAFR